MFFAVFEASVQGWRLAVLVRLQSNQSADGGQPFVITCGGKGAPGGVRGDHRRQPTTAQTATV
jgi:hypothetical protein